MEYIKHEEKNLWTLARLRKRQENVKFILNTGLGRRRLGQIFGVIYQGAERVNIIAPSPD